jgi:hypothetical protein
MARLFASTPQSEHAEQNVEALATLFSSQDIETIAPASHVEALTLLLNLILESKYFKDYMQSLDEAINETRRNHYERLNEKRALETQAMSYGPLIESMDKGIESAEAALNAAYIDDDIVSGGSSGDSPTTVIDVDLAMTQNRHEAKRRLQEKKARIAEMKRDVSALIKQRNGLVSSADSIQRKLSKLEKDDEEYPSVLEKLKHCVRGDSLRLLGLDREGKRYWNIELRQETVEEMDSDVSGPLPEVPVGGIMTETVFYDVMEVTEIAEEDSAPKKTSSKVKKMRKRRESDDDSEGTDETGSSYHDDGDEYSSDLSVAVLDAEGVEVAKSQAAKRTVLKLGIESVYGYVDSKATALRLSRTLHERGIRESSLKKKLLAFVQDTDKKNADELANNSIYNSFSSWCLGDSLERNNISPQVQNFSAYMFDQIHNIIPMICAAFELEMPASDPQNLQDCLQLIEVWMENPKARKVWTLTQMTREAKHIKTLASLIYWFNRVETIGVQIHEQDEANRKSSSSQSRATQSDDESASQSDAGHRKKAPTRGGRKGPKAKKKKAVARRSSRKVIAKTYKESESDETSASESSSDNDNEKSGSRSVRYFCFTITVCMFYSCPLLQRVQRIDSSDESQEEESGQDSNGSRRTRSRR